jgi:hypothetical protein
VGTSTHRHHTAGGEKMDTPNPTSKLILTIREFDENDNPSLWFWQGNRVKE